MPSSITLTNTQSVGAGITVLDKDKQPFEKVPTGMVVAFESTKPEVASFEVGEDGMNGKVTSGKVGNAVITATVQFPDGSTKSDTLSVAVANSAPDALNFTVGTPEDEMPVPVP